MPNYNDFDISGPYEGGGSKWGQVGSILSDLGSSVGGGKSYAASLGSLGSLFGGVGGAIGAGVGGAIDLGTSISSLFRPSVEGMQKIDATKAQQYLEQMSAGIERQVKEGSMSPGVAIKALKNLAMIASGYGSNAKDQAGMMRVLGSINQQLANIQGDYNWSLGKNVQEGTMDKGAAGGLTANIQDPNQQTDWIKQQLKNKLAGFSAGDKNLSGSPLEKLFRPAFDVAGQSDTMMTKAKSYMPDYKEPSAFDAIRKRLGALNG